MSRVSVLIAVYNACTHLRACLDHLLSYRNTLVEIIDSKSLKWAKT